MNTLDCIYNKWNSKVVTGDIQPVKPSLCNFNNVIPAIELLHRYMEAEGHVVIHCDVDMDGFGSGFILRKFFSSISPVSIDCVTNKEKQHGIVDRQVEYFNSKPYGLVIIVDSASNDLEYIKKIQHDVLVVDHHEIGHTETLGLTNDGHKFVIVNNMIGNSDCDTTRMWLNNLNKNSSEIIEEYKSTPDMSCGLVIYELLRVYQEAYSKGPLLENLMLDQWAGVTLFTDSILLCNDRNQWYITKTCYNNLIEPTLGTLARSISSFNLKLSKTVINFSIAPVINKAIRGSASGDALRIVMSEPSGILRLDTYKDMQADAIEKACKMATEFDSYVLCDITNTGISKNYTGVIAGKLCDEYNKNAVTYTVTNGMAQGSFRGRLGDTDYRSVFDNFSDTSSGAGHKVAFGFGAKLTELHSIMAELTTVEQNFSSKEYLTAGNVDIEDRGVYHLDNIDEFKKAGGIMRLAIGNSRVSSDEQIMIMVPASEAKLKEQHGKLYVYDVLGIECKAFKEINSKYIHIYPEFNKCIEIYIK